MLSLFECSMSFLKFHKPSNTLIYIVSYIWQSHILDNGLVKHGRMSPLVAMREGQGHTSHE